MKLTLSAIHNIDVLGELLRDLFFDQRHGVGCYETFILRSNIIKLHSTTVEFDEDFSWQRARLTLEFWDRGFISYAPVDMWYYWNGDGTLAFVLKDFVLMNVDCKKDYHWRKLTHKEWQYYRAG